MASTLGVPLQVRVHTADRKGAGTDARVFIKLRDSAGTESRLTQLDNLHVDDHERNTVSEFELPASTAAALVDLDSIVLVRNAAGADGGSWLLELVEVSAGGGRWLFPVHRWLSPYTEYRISQFDSSLPQHDDPDISARRARELLDKRGQYQYAQHIAGGPVQIKTLPEDEQFSEKYQFGFGRERETLMMKTEAIGMTEDKWNSFEEMMEAVKSTIGTPDVSATQLCSCACA
ncbi:uncharacterized protein LOC122369423, partial [Amphibalanus amphitrite]|uniref:uncharacterized protein LOC122369423 n=1 Tax=Amphibalanus amphitrite TaxID=1232801 RepID=UPI001C9243CD